MYTKYTNKTKRSSKMNKSNNCRQHFLLVEHKFVASNKKLVYNYYFYLFLKNRIFYLLNILLCKFFFIRFFIH